MPDWKKEVTRRLAALKLEPAREAEIAEELAQHLEDRFRELVSGGAAEDQAQRAALAELSDEKLLARGLRGVEREAPEKPIVVGSSVGKNFLSSLWQDVRYGLRQLRRNPGFTALALLTLAVGIGANAAIFSMVDAILLRALPYRQSAQLYVIHEVVPQWTRYYPVLPVTGGNFLLWQKDCNSFAGMAALMPRSGVLLGVGPAKFLRGAEVTADVFPMLGIQPQAGRAFRPEEDQPGRASEIILTDQLWRQVFHSDPHILGRAVNLGGHALTVVGVLPAAFRFPKLLAYAPQYFVPVVWGKGNSRPSIGTHNYTVIARLKPVISPRQAVTELNVIEARIARKSAGGKFGLYATLTPLKTAIVGSIRRALWMLVAAAGFVLLIICVNLANLLLVKNTARTHEVAVRSALGATAPRLARQSLTEAMILAAAGGLLGLLLAELGLRLLVRAAPLGIPRLSQIRVDPRVLWFTLGVSLVSLLLFALLPALRLAKVQPVEALKSAGPAVSRGKSAARLRGGLVATEIALSAVLLAAALLLIESLTRVLRVNEWMAKERVLTASLIAPPNEYRTRARRDAFYSSILDKVQRLPGVQTAGFVNALPLEGHDWGDAIRFQELPRPGTEITGGEFRFVSPGYFSAIGLPLIKGRFFRPDDRGKRVALISESVAQKLLSGHDPLGMHVGCRGSGKWNWCRVIGVVANVRTASDEPPILAAYFPLWIYSEPSETLVVRTGMAPRAAATAIRQAIRQANPDTAIPREQALKTIVQTSIAPRRYLALLGALFALCAIFLAALGLYGVISYSVSQRTHEMGIRLALGAEGGDVLRLVVRQGLVLALAGVAIGIAGALALTRLLSSLLFGVKPGDPLTLITVAVILTALALLACYIPARRATKVDPIVALRYE